MILFRSRLTLAFALVIALLAILTAPSHAQFVVYDNFTGGAIDPNLWSGVSNEGNFGAPTAEVIRTVENGQLRLGLVSWGNDTTDSGSTLSRVGLQVRQLGTLGGAGSIIGVKAKVTVLDATVQDCVANPETGGSIRARASFVGWFFSDGTSPGGTDVTGNMIAGWQLTKEADGTNQFQVLFQRCANASCSTAVTPAGISVPAFTTTWSPNTPVVIKEVWDRVNGKFKFTINSSGTVESHSIVYQGVVTDAGAPVSSDFKQFRLHNNVKNCTAGRKKVVMDALFDKIAFQRQP